MKTSTTTSLFCSLIAFAALPLASIAGQPTGGTTTPAVAFGGTAIPGGSQTTSYVINSSGTYFLAGERVMTADVPAIVVNAPDVTIDLNGGTIRYAGGSNTWGIRIPDCSNVEIRNGSITDVPGSGIASSGGSGLRISNVRITSCTRVGITLSTSMTTIDRCDISYCSEWGVYTLDANSVRVTNSNISRCGKTGIFIGGNAKNGEISNCNVTFNQVQAIRTYSPGCLIANNIVSNNNLAKGFESAIYVGPRSVVRGNVVESNFGTGIYVFNIGGQCVVDGNVIVNTYEADGITLGTAIDQYGSGALYTNNRITAGSKMSASLVNGGGNLFY